MFVTCVVTVSVCIWWEVLTEGMHTLNYRYTGILHNESMVLSIMGYFDEQNFMSYYANLTNNVTVTRINSTVDWMRNITDSYPTYWDGEKHKADLIFNYTQMNLIELFFHLGNENENVLTWFHECNTTTNGSFREGYEVFGWDGYTMMELKGNLSRWSKPDNTQRNWVYKKNSTYMEGKIKGVTENDTMIQRNYLTGNCTEWANIYGGHHTPVTHPEVRAGRRHPNGDMIGMFCTAYGFYPGEINITFVRQDDATLSFHNYDDLEPDNGPVLPHSDGTFHKGSSLTTFDNFVYTCVVHHGNWSVELPIRDVEEEHGVQAPTLPYKATAISGVLFVVLCVLLVVALHYLTTLKQYLRRLASGWRYRKVSAS
ncbi:membrane glycoprotein UL18 [Panine betaherpesvirus 2]|uniref:Membrane glycoprotein UL18 n=1 Tax=Panine betaherpesvirus 2 TaxID=188763 RepID=Q8QHT1_9BETA|nr:membrane glycoprotein UL18 [Panine betaherpesvirus 2]AAM00668.1 membrane glycoprotein UL18 [Panine betaherpesvirus 2]QXV67770.1 membrane glycoprotein UL18 [Panine betaherpesvirus 2]